MREFLYWSGFVAVGATIGAVAGLAYAVHRLANLGDGTSGGLLSFATTVAVVLGGAIGAWCGIGAGMLFCPTDGDER